MWAAIVCPDCAEAHSVPERPGTLPCRAHPLSGRAVNDASVELTRTTLMDLAGRVRALTDSRTQSGRAALVNASRLQAVSWFNGWDFPLTFSR